MPTRHTLFDYFGDGVVFVYEPQKIKERIRTFAWQIGEDVKSAFEEGILTKGLDDFYLSKADVFEKLNNAKTIVLESFNATKSGIEPKS